MRRETDEIPLADVDYRIPGVYSDEDLLSRNLIRRMAIETGSIVWIAKASSQETLRLKHFQALIQLYALSALGKSLHLIFDTGASMCNIMEVAIQYLTYYG